MCSREDFPLLAIYMQSIIKLHNENNKIGDYPKQTKRNKEGLDRYMKATGIVRRIDDLGRVVIPKEIRRTMRIREGDPSQTTLTPFNRFCYAMLEMSKRIGDVRKDTFDDKNSGRSTENILL